tara:strand:+ start:70 stop:777 length:708 start_codon:yes stop_codon:yes gene_type:complete
MRKIILRGFSKKFKGTQKLPAQKTPKIKSLTDNEIKLRQSKIADQNIRNTVGTEDFPNFSHRSLESIRAISIGDKISVRRFDRSLQKALKETRKITATGIKGRKLKVKQPTKPTFAQTSAGVFKGSSIPRSKPSLIKAKNKGAMKAYKIADTKAENSFQKTLRRFTDKTKVSSFKNRTAATKRPLSGFEGEQGQYVQAMRNMGFDTKDFYYGVPTQGRISKRHANYLDKLAKKKK